MVRESCTIIQIDCQKVLQYDLGAVNRGIIKEMCGFVGNMSSEVVHREAMVQGDFVC